MTSNSKFNPDGLRFNKRKLKRDRSKREDGIGNGCTIQGSTMGVRMESE